MSVCVCVCGCRWNVVQPCQRDWISSKFYWIILMLWSSSKRDGSGMVGSGTSGWNWTVAMGEVNKSEKPQHNWHLAAVHLLDFVFAFCLWQLVSCTQSPERSLWLRPSLRWRACSWRECTLTVGTPTTAEERSKSRLSLRKPPPWLCSSWKSKSQVNSYRYVLFLLLYFGAVFVSSCNIPFFAHFMLACRCDWRRKEIDDKKVL